MAGRLARPPYVDPNTNIIYDTDNPEYSGFLTKQSMWLKVGDFAVERRVVVCDYPFGMR